MNQNKHVLTLSILTLSLEFLVFVLFLSCFSSCALLPHKNYAWMHESYTTWEESNKWFAIDKYQCMKDANGFISGDIQQLVAQEYMGGGIQNGMNYAIANNRIENARGQIIAACLRSHGWRLVETK
jgi:hypothetical protein